MQTKRDTPSTYRAVESLVQSGKLRILHIDAPPRTISSAFQVALTEGADGHLYEPFRRHKGPRSLERTCRDILTLYREINDDRAQSAGASANAPADDRQVVITVKELAQFIHDKDFEEWLPLVGGWVSIVRSPNTQMQSFMTRSILDGTYFQKPEIEETRRALQDKLGHEPTEHEVVQALSEEFRIGRVHTEDAKTRPHRLETPGFDMWGQLSRHFAEVQKHNIPTAVVDGTVLCADPDHVMRHVTKALKLPFNERMLLGWTVASGKNLIPDRPISDLKQDAWIEDVLKSRSFSPPSNQPLPLSMFTPTVRGYTEKALGVFVDLANSKYAILPRKPKDIDRLLATPVQEGTFFGTDLAASETSDFMHTQPIAAYSIALSMPAADEAERTYKRELLTRLEDIHRDYYGDSFQLMRERQQGIDTPREGGRRDPESFAAAKPAPKDLKPGGDDLRRTGRQHGNPG